MDRVAKLHMRAPLTPRSGGGVLLGFGAVCSVHIWWLPVAVRTALANSRFLAARDYHSLVDKADLILMASRTLKVHAVAADLPVASPSTSPGLADLVLTAGIATRRHRWEGLCFYHQRFGAKAHRCLPPCSFLPQGNGVASTL